MAASCCHAKPRHNAIAKSSCCVRTVVQANDLPQLTAGQTDGCGEHCCCGVKQKPPLPAPTPGPLEDTKVDRVEFAEPLLTLDIAIDATPFSHVSAHLAASHDANTALDRCIELSRFTC